MPMACILQHTSCIICLKRAGKGSPFAGKVTNHKALPTHRKYIATTSLEGWNGEQSGVIDGVGMAFSETFFNRRLAAYLVAISKKDAIPNCVCHQNLKL